MVSILKYLGYIAFFIVALVYCMPQESIYNYLQEELSKQKVVISNEKVLEHTFSLELSNASISYKDIKSVKVLVSNVNLFLVHNSISSKDIVVLETSTVSLPAKIDLLNFKHSIFNPLNISITSSGEFGTARGNINILENSIFIKVMPSELMKKNYMQTLRQLTKNDDGSYDYEKTF